MGEDDQVTTFPKWILVVTVVAALGTFIAFLADAVVEGPNWFGLVATISGGVCGLLAAMELRRRALEGK